MTALVGGSVALVGRPNVGKSTLFNRLCGGRDALVHDRPALTRDRKYGRAVIGERTASVIDTGGLYDSTIIADAVNAQVKRAIEEADVIVLLMDARAGLTPADELILDELRVLGKPIQLVVNKIDGVRESQRLALQELSGLGFGDVACISATHGHGIGQLRDAIEPHLEKPMQLDVLDSIPVAVIGRPNVGKSTLVNAMLGDERCVVFDEPGTTRDSIYVPFERDSQRFTFIDTAGIRRKGRVRDVVEKFSVIKALDAMNVADVGLLLIDATEGIVDQDLHIVKYAVDSGSGLILVVNKTDAIDANQRRGLKNELERRLRFAPWIPILYTSAVEKSGINRVFKTVVDVHRVGRLDIATSELNRVVQTAVDKHPPPTHRGRPIKVRYVNKLGDHPPALLVHGSQVEVLPDAYVRYLENQIRAAFKLVGVPVVLSFRNTENPFRGRRNELTPGQLKHRRRLIQRRKAQAKRKRSS
ncbi:MAG: ribosome biogenesis GTPase Der [Gammaproteobacteria bacterium]|nr:ribosome biogenesis GTPase Der [Gammaproteobacteria bacterium]